MLMSHCQAPRQISNKHPKPNTKDLRPEDSLTLFKEDLTPLSQIDCQNSSY